MTENDGESSETHRILLRRIRRLEYGLLAVIGLLMGFVVQSRIAGIDNLQVESQGPGRIDIRSLGGSQSVRLVAEDDQGFAGQVSLDAAPEIQSLNMVCRSGEIRMVTREGVGCILELRGSSHSGIEMSVSESGQARIRVRDTEGKVVWSTP